jgi:outer membrane receptor protein involved in Fe transport
MKPILYILKFISFLVWVFLSSLNGFAQETTYVSGKVLTLEAEPIFGVTIRYGDAGTATDANGNFGFYIESDKPEFRLVISYIGYQTLDSILSLEQCKTPMFFYMVESGNVLETATVTSGRYTQSLAKSSVSLEIIKPQLVRSTNITSIDALLNKVPGVNIVDGQANIRGGSGFSYGAGSRVLLLIDDVPALQSDAGSPNWTDIPFELIDQLEILKGAASSLYGANALNGIINVRTLWPGLKPQTTVNLQRTQFLSPKNKAQKWWDSAGDVGETNFYLTHARKIGNFDFVLSGLYNNFKSFQQSAGREDLRLTAKTRYRISDRTAITLSTNYNKGNSSSYFYWLDGEDNALLPSPDTENTVERERVFIDATLTSFTAKGNRHKVLTRIYDVNNNTGENRSVNSSLYFGEYQYLHEFSDDLKLTAGSSLAFTRVLAELYGNFPFSSYTNAYYVQVDKNFGDRFSVNAGGRYEFNQINTPKEVGKFFIEDGKISESRPVFKLGANYQLAEFGFLRASFGQGYRYPTIAEMFVETNINILPITPNPNLRSENGYTTEIGLKQGFIIQNFKGFADIALFHMRYNRMMEFVFTGLIDGFQSQNIGDTRNTGIELSVGGKGKIGNMDFHLMGGYTYIDPRYINFTEFDQQNSSSDVNILKYRSRHMAKMDIQMAYRALNLGLSFNHMSHMEAIDQIFNFLVPGLMDFRESNKGFLLTDARVNYQATEKIILSLFLNNVFNIAYSTRPGLLDAPRNIGTKVLLNF